jgi:predicted Zn-dependent protease
MFSSLPARDSSFMSISQKNVATETLGSKALERTDTAPAQAPGTAFHPNMLLVRWEIASRARDWSSALAIAKALIAALPVEPIGWIYHAFAEHQMGHLQEARQTLLAGFRKFPKDWRIAYNLACYTAQLGDVAGAWNWLDSALSLGDAAVIKSLAAKEQSLKPLSEKSGLNSKIALHEPAPASQPRMVSVGFAV